MAKKQVMDTNSTKLSGAKKRKTAKADTQKQAPEVTVTLANAPIYSAIYTQRLFVEMRKFNEMFGDVVRMLREQTEKDG